MESDIIARITNSIQRLEELKDSNDIIGIGKVCNELSTASAYFAKLVADAYQLMNEAEDDYKLALAEKIKELTEDGDAKGMAAAKAERFAEVALKEKKIHWTACRNNYKRFDLRLDRIDRMLDEFKQYVASVKAIELKHGNYQTT